MMMTTTRIPEMLGHLKNLNTIKKKTFKSHEPIFYSHREHNKCLNREMLHFYPLNELISNLMPATGL